MKELRTEVQVTLRQILTPQLYQLLKLLQMPYLELEQTVRGELAKNPLLEEEQESEEEQDTIPRKETTIREETKEIDWSQFFQGDYDRYYRPTQRSRENLPERVPVSLPSIRDNLLEQVHLHTSDEQARIIGEYLIDSLDDDGFLDTDPSEVADILHVSEERVLDILKLIQTFDPPGVGSRGVEECLTIQLFQNGYTDDDAEVKIVQNFLKEVGAKKLNKIKKRLHISEIRIREAIEIISSLNPKPFRGLGSGNIRYIVPDIIMKKIDNNYEIELNETTIPRLKISSYYKEILDEKENLLKEEKEFIKQKLNSAVNLMRGLEQRRHSILRVVRYIIKQQRDFFEEGISKMAPLTMQKVAETVDLHESTVSRIVQGKYIDTPRGILPLKFFFGGSVSCKDNTNISTRSVKEKIKIMVEKEDKQHPLQDKQIVKILDTDGITLARRTVAKYRTQMNILPARLRKGN